MKPKRPIKIKLYASPDEMPFKLFDKPTLCVTLNDAKEELIMDIGFQPRSIKALTIPYSDISSQQLDALKTGSRTIQETIIMGLFDWGN